MKTAVSLLMSTIGIAAIAPGPLLAATEPGLLMELTVYAKEQVSGMPTAPTRTLHKKICTNSSGFDPRAFVNAQSKTDCKIENYKKAGTTITFDVMCGGRVPVTSHGEFHLTGGSDFTGSMHTTLSAAGRNITVDTEYTGKKAGVCEYRPPKTSG